MLRTCWRLFTATTPAYFLRMLIQPARTIERVSAARPTFWSLAIFITVISLARGFLEGILSLLSEGQLFGLWSAGRLLPWLIFKAYPLILADWFAGYVRWLGFALVPYLVGRFCGGTGRLSDFLRLYGIILGIYVVTILPNFAYFVVPLPMVRFHAAPEFNPTLGVGQFITSAWLVWVTYLVVRRLHGLPVFESLMIGLLTPTLNIAALVLPGSILFNLAHVQIRQQRSLPYVPLLLFSAACLLLLVGMLLLIRWLQQTEARHPLMLTAERRPSGPAAILDQAERPEPTPDSMIVRSSQ